VDVRVLGEEKPGYHIVLSNDYPVFAVDFLRIKDTMYGIDLNTAPGMTWTGMKDLVSSREIYELVRWWFVKYRFESQGGDALNENNP
jgi:hypothetical protein